MKKLDWLTMQDKDKIVKTIFQERDTNNLRQTRRSKISKQLHTPRRKEKFDLEKMELVEIKSEDESEDISRDDSSNEDYSSDCSSIKSSCSSLKVPRSKPKHKKKQIKVSTFTKTYNKTLINN